MEMQLVDFKTDDKKKKFKVSFFFFLPPPSAMSMSSLSSESERAASWALSDWKSKALFLNCLDQTKPPTYQL